jgi:hypothetical protein
MFLKSKFTRIVCSLCLVFALAAISFADTIRLKDGSIIKGKIVNFSGGQFTVVIGDGSRQRRMNFYADEIESIEFDENSMPVSNVKTSTQLPVKPNSNTTNNTNSSNKPSNDTIITVPAKTETNNNSSAIPTNNSSNTDTNNNPTYTNSLPKTNTPKPVQLTVKVLADNTANGWTNSGWVVKKGQRIKITGRGSVSLGNGNFSTPGGIPALADKGKLMANEVTGGLIAVIGDDNNDFIFVGGSKEFVAARDGSLFLGINEGNLDDNSGAYDVTIEILP